MNGSWWRPPPSNPWDRPKPYSATDKLFMAFAIFWLIAFPPIGLLMLWGMTRRKKPPAS